MIFAYTRQLKPPLLEGGKVTELAANNIPNLLRALDFAEKGGGVSLLLSLYSSDLLQDQAGADHLANQKPLVELDFTNAHIGNALLPMVTAVKNYSALWAWEIFEPPVRIDMK